MNNFIFNKHSHKLFGIRISAIFEILVFLSILTLLNYIFGDGSRFINYALHPFWIIVLLVTVQYGTAEGVFAAILSSVFLYADNIPLQKAEESTFEYQLRLGTLPALWFITAFILGELRMRLEWEIERLRNDYIHAKSEVEKITAEYLVLKESNQHLEVQLTSQEETVAASFRVFKALAALEPAQIIFGLNSIVDIAIHPYKFSVFAKGPNGLEAVTSEGWKAQDKYCRRFIPSAPLYVKIVDEKKMISAVNREEQKILQAEGVLAAPLVDPDSGEVFGMVKIEEISFRSLNMSRMETFRTVCELIGRAYSNAKKHRSTKQLSIYGFTENLYSFPLYKIISSYIQKWVDEVKMLVLKLHLLHTKQYDEEWLKQLQSGLPPETLYFEGQRKLKELILLFPLSKEIQAQEMKERLEQWLVSKGQLNLNDFEIQQERLSQRNSSST